MPKIAAVCQKAADYLGQPFPRGIVLRQKRLRKCIDQIPEESVKASFAMSDEEISEDRDYFDDLRGEAFFDELDREFFNLLRTENGGYQAAMDEFIKANT